MKLPGWITTATAAVAACRAPRPPASTSELKPGVSTAAEVRSRLGNPAYEHRNDDGSVTWEYNRQPSTASSAT